MADPVVSYFKSDDITELNSLNPEDFGEVIMGNSSAAQEIHIWNDKGGSAGSNPMYNTQIKVVTATGLDSGDSLEDGSELVTNQWVSVKSVTNDDPAYTLLGNGAVLNLGTINGNADHIISLIEIVPSDATPVPPNGDIAFELEVLYDLLPTS